LLRKECIGLCDCFAKKAEGESLRRGPTAIIFYPFSFIFYQERSDYYPYHEKPPPLISRSSSHKTSTPTSQWGNFECRSQSELESIKAEGDCVAKKAEGDCFAKKAEGESLRRGPAAIILSLLSFIRSAATIIPYQSLRDYYLFPYPFPHRRNF